MKKQCVLLVGLILVAGLSTGCLSRSRVTLGPISVAGESQIFAEPQEFSFDLSLNKIGFTVGQFSWSLESDFGTCEQVIGFDHATGNTSKVNEYVPSLK